ncbi:MAG: DUF6056 family protein [Rikenellaceae bacterium]
MKNNYKLLLTILPIVAIFYFINCGTVFTGDDLNYQCGINSARDILSMQYDHYFGWGGRVIVHAILQLFVAIFDKPVFDVINTFVFIVFIYLTIALINRSLLKNHYAWGTVAICVAFLLPSHVSFYGVGALALNYLWGLTFCLLFLYIWKYHSFKRFVFTIPLSLCCFILGWSQELFALPIAGALCLYYLINRREIFTQRTIASFAFCLGVLVLIVAPGNWARLETSSGLFSNLLKLALRLFESPSILIILAISIYLIYKFKFAGIVNILRDNLLYVFIFIISVILCIKFPATGTRVLMGISYWWMMLIAIILIPRLKKSLLFKRVYGVLYSLMIVLSAMVGYYSYANSANYNTLVSGFIHSENGVVFIDEPQIPTILKSSIMDPYRLVNKEAIGSRYGDSTKNLFAVNSGVLVVLDEVILQQIKGDFEFYKTNEPDYYILRGYEKYGTNLNLTISGADSDAEFVKLILSKISASRYLPMEKKLDEKNIVYLDYKGEVVAIMHNPYDTREVIAIEPIKTEI